MCGPPTYCPDWVDISPRDCAAPPFSVSALTQCPHSFRRLTPAWQRSPHHFNKSQASTHLAKLYAIVPYCGDKLKPSLENSFWLKKKTLLFIKRNWLMVGAKLRLTNGLLNFKISFQNWNETFIIGIYLAGQLTTSRGPVVPAIHKPHPTGYCDVNCF